MTPIWRPSPNFGPRRDGARPDLIVIHYTAMAACDAALERLCAPEYEVSAHYLISENGECFQMVAEDQRAWHAGAGSWGAVTDVNSHSIGIELSNTGFHPFAEAQMSALETLLGAVMARHKIPPERVIGHSDMAPGRKIDPGARFDWRRFARGGLSVWPEQISPEDPAAFAALMQRFGYGPGHDEATLLNAFRSRFRPGATGPVDAIDAGMIRNLATRFPVDLPAQNP